MERFVKDPHTLRQKRQGPLCPHIDEFAQHRKGLVAAPVTPVERTTIDKLLDDFSLYLQQERVLAALESKPAQAEQRRLRLWRLRRQRRQQPFGFPPVTALLR